MADKITIRRGLEADLPTLTTAELGFTTDSQKLFIGSDSGNLLITGLIGSTDFTVDGYVNPQLDNTYGLGTPTSRWAHASLGPSSLHITSTAAETGGQSYDWTIGLNSDGNLSISQSDTEYIAIDLDHGLKLGDSLTLQKVSSPTTEAGIGKVYYNTSDGKLHFIDEVGLDIELSQGAVTSVNTYTGAVVLDSSDVGAVPTTDKGIPLGVATLDVSGKITTSQLPALAITETSVVASEAAMLAVTAQTGDVAVRTDESKSYILSGTDPSILAHWTELLSPVDSVLSVNGETGVVVLDTDHISEGATNLWYTEGRVSANTNVTSNTTHRGLTNNPHATDIGNLGSGTLAELNAAITDATLDGTGDSRDPNAHASTHNDGGADEITAQDLGSGAAAIGKLIETDGAGGWNLVDSANDLPGLDTAVRHILNDIDGYALDSELQSQKTKQGLDTKAIIDVIDGYALDTHLQNQKTKQGLDTKAVIDVIDGYGLDSELQPEIRRNDHQDTALSDILGSLDGYSGGGGDTSDLDEAMTHVLDSLDGYALDAELQPEIRRNDHQDTALGDILSSLDGYSGGGGDTSDLDEAMTHVLDSLDGYALDSELQPEIRRNDHQDTALGDILSDLDGYALDSELQSEVRRNDHQDTALSDIIGDLDGYHTLKVSSNDTTADYLISKLTAGTNIIISESNDGGNETVTISSTASGGGGGGGDGYLSRVSVGDQISGFLDDKIVGGDYVVLEILNDDADEELQIGVPAINDIIGSLDGYGAEIRRNDHQDTALGDILADLDGYALDSELQPEVRRNDHQDTALSDILDSLDGYSGGGGDTSDLDEAMTHVLDSLDGYALDSELQPEIRRNDHQDTALSDILDSLDGYSGGGGGTPDGSDGQVQYNNGGSFGGAAQLYYDDVNDRVGIGDSSPNERLHVELDTDGKCKMLVNNPNTGTSAYAQIGLSGSANALNIYAFGESYNASTIAGENRTDAVEFEVGNSSKLMIGTSNASPLHFYTDSTKAMTVDTSQRVGIGGSPSYPLHVLTDDNSTQVVRFDNDSAGTSANMNVGVVCDGNAAFMAVHSALATGDSIGVAKADRAFLYASSACSNGLAVGATTGVLKLCSDGAEALTIDTSQRVGIGGDPSYPLHVRVDNDSTQIVRFDNDNTGTSADMHVGVGCDSNSVYVSVYSASNTGSTAGITKADRGFIYSTSACTNGLVVGANDGPLKLYSDAAEAINIDSSQLVSIGTSTANERLTVEGAISLDEIAAPGNTSGYGKIYVKSSDSKLYFKDSSGTETDLTAGGGASALDDLNDVSIGTPAAGHNLRYNGTKWVNGKVELGDIDSGIATSNQLLVWGGTAWAPGSVSLSKIVQGGASADQVLVWGGTTWTPGSVALGQVASGGASSNDVLAWNGSAWGPGSVSLSKIASGGATTGQVLSWTGTAWAPGASDKRLKTDISQIDDALEKIMQINGVHFRWNEAAQKFRKGYKPEKVNIGLLAQEVEKVFPELVGQGKVNEDGTQFKSVLYDKMTAVLVEAVKELNQKLNAVLEIIEENKKR